MKLREQLGGPNGDLGGVRRALTGSAPGQVSEDEQMEHLVAHQDVAVLREGLERMKAGGFKAIAAMNDLRLLAVLKDAPAGSVPQVLPVVPNIAGLMRDAVEHGMVGAGLRRVFKLNPSQMAGLVWRSMGRLKPLAQGDFPARLRSFIELELDAFRRFDPPVVFLQAQMTDLAVAMNNPALLVTYIEAVASRTGAQPGFATRNLAAFFELADRAGIQAAAVLAPWSAGEAHMRPNAAVCREAVKQHPGVSVWADRLGMIQEPGAALRQSIAENKLAGAARDDITIWR